MAGMTVPGNPAEKKKKLVLPPDVDPEIKKDLMESTCRVSMRVEKADGKLKAEFSYDDNTNNVYKHFEKFFDGWKQLAAYGDKFLALGEDEEDESLD